MSKEELKDEDPAQVTQPHPEDEVIHAPKGTKKGRFLLGVLLAFLTLTTFSISGEIVQFFSCGPSARSAYMVWNHPTEGQKQVPYADFLLLQRQYAKVWDVFTGSSNRQNLEQEVAELILFDALAQNAGVGITNKELSEMILARMGSQEVYQQLTKRAGTTPKEFEETLRKILRADRYRALIASSVSIADPAEVEKLWKARHQEYAFDYVELSADSLAAEATAAVPASDALKAWFDALSEPEKNKYKTQEMAKAQVLFKTIGPQMKAEELVAKYPPASLDLEARAKTYYDGFYYVRFPNPDFKPDPKNFDPSQFYLPFEKAREQCLVEEPIYTAAEAFIADMIARTDKNETVDFLMEGQSYRFGVRNQPEMMSRADWSKEGVEGWGRYVADVIFDPNLKPGTIQPHVVVEKNAFVIVKLIERQDARMPEFSEIEARVREDWIKKKQGELAVTKLEALRDKLGARPADTDPGAALWRPEADEATFAKVVQEAGFQVQRRDFQERTTPPKPGEAVAPAQTFLQQAGALYSMKEGSVAKAEPSRDQTKAYLVRVAGIRDADLSKMTPLELQSLGQQAAQTAVTDFRTRVLASREELTKAFGLHLKSWDAKQEPAAP
ncbi:MAG: hypothetical protein IPJ77_08080 [Planctomycetes bacterium]|nr:hypothetical protein [Planctomycetota bacterium]